MAKYLPHFPLYLPSQGPFPGADRDSYNESRYWLNREICNSFSPILAGALVRKNFIHESMHPETR